MADLISPSSIRIPVSSDSKRILGLAKVAKPLTAGHLRLAAAKYQEANGKIASYEESTHFDVVIDGKRYPPKVILGIALSDYYGVNVRFEHFSGGEKCACFQVLHKLGFQTGKKMATKLKREDETFDYSSFKCSGIVNLAI
ncbi:hypothetical protein ACOI2Q_18385 [Shewanella algae]|uniref:hypothetical protein n=1 Tax=Shewanella algae TaxID=38313 RepID=UPI003B678D00